MGYRHYLRIDTDQFVCLTGIPVALSPPARTGGRPLKAVLELIYVNETHQFAPVVADITFVPHFAPPITIVGRLAQ